MKLHLKTANTSPTLIQVAKIVKGSASNSIYVQKRKKWDHVPLVRFPCKIWVGTSCKMRTWNLTQYEYIYIHIYTHKHIWSITVFWTVDHHCTSFERQFLELGVFTNPSVDPWTPLWISSAHRRSKGSYTRQSPTSCSQLTQTSVPFFTGKFRIYGAAVQLA